MSLLHVTHNVTSDTIWILLRIFVSHIAWRKTSYFLITHTRTHFDKSDTLLGNQLQRQKKGFSFLAANVQLLVCVTGGDGARGCCRWCIDEDEFWYETQSWIIRQILGNSSVPNAHVGHCDRTIECDKLIEIERIPNTMSLCFNYALLHKQNWMRVCAIVQWQTKDYKDAQRQFTIDTMSPLMTTLQ